MQRLIVLSLVLFLAACSRGGGSDTPAPPDATGATVTTLSLSPGTAELTLAPASAQDVRVFGIRADGSKVDLTDAVEWRVDGEAVAAAQGRIQALAAGQANVEIRYGDLRAELRVVVKDEPPTRLLSDPDRLDLYPGQEAGVRLLGEFPDARVQDLSGEAAWQLSGTGASLDADRPGRVHADEDPASEGQLTLTATWNGQSVTVPVTVNPARLTGLTVDDTAPRLRVGERLRPEVTAWYTLPDGRLVSRPFAGSLPWTSSDETVVATEGDALLALAPGSVTVTAALGDLALTLNLTVASPRPQALEIRTPALEVAAGQSLALAAWARYDDGAWREISDSATWTVSDPRLALVGNGAGDSGRLRAIAPGSVTVTAALGDLRATLDLSVQPAFLERLEISPLETRLLVGERQDFQAIGHYSDGSLHDLTADASWTVSDPALARIETLDEARGRLTALASGNLTVHASLGGVSAEARVTVHQAALTGLNLVAETLEVSAGSSLVIRALGQLEDGSETDLTDQVQWQSNDETVLAPAQEAGRFLALAPGQVRVSAVYTDADHRRSSALLQISVVDAPLVALEWLDEAGQPLDTLTLASGTRRPLRLRGRFQDGHTQDLSTQATLQTADGDTAARLLHLDDGPWLVGLFPGTLTLTATLDGVTATLPVTVTGAALQGIELAPELIAVPAGGERRLAALGRFDDGSRQDLTAQVVWSSDDPGIAQVSNGSGVQGTLLGVAVGQTYIHADFGGQHAQATVTVSDDPTAVAGLSLIAEPNALLDYRTADCAATPSAVRDRSTLRVRLRALGEGAQVADGTSVTLVLTWPDGREETRQLSTTAGVAETVLESPACLTGPEDGGEPVAVIRLRAEVTTPDGLTFVRRGVLTVVRSLSYLFTGRAWVLGPVSTDTLDAGTRFALLMLNLSNREFTVRRLGLFQGGPDLQDLRLWIDEDPQTPPPTSLIQDTALGEGGAGLTLPGGMAVIASLTLEQARANSPPFALLYNLYDAAAQVYSFWGIYPDTRP